MNDLLIFILSLIGLIVLYWVLFMQHKYNQTFRDHFQPGTAQMEKKFDEIQAKELEKELKSKPTKKENKKEKNGKIHRN